MHTILGSEEDWRNIMNSWHSYPKVYNLGHAAINGVLEGYVFVQEKIDGSQFSFGVIDGKLRIKSHYVEMDPECPQQMFNQAVEIVKALYKLNKLHPGWTYRGEYLQKPHHNILTYARIPNNNIILFDINTGEEEYLPPGNVREEAARLGLEAVPTLDFKTDGKFDLDYLEKLLQTPSVLGNTTIEGVVIKNYDKFGKDKKVMMGKFVSEAFKEQNKKAFKHSTGKNIVQILVDGYKTEARWEKAVQHLKEKGELLEEPKDIGNLIKEVINDVIEECEDEIKNKLFAYFIKDIKGGIIRGLPEWYKKKLSGLK